MQRLKPCWWEFLNALLVNERPFTEAVIYGENRLLQQMEIITFVASSFNWLCHISTCGFLMPRLMKTNHWGSLYTVHSFSDRTGLNNSTKNGITIKPVSAKAQALSKFINLKQKFCWFRKRTKHVSFSRILVKLWYPNCFTTSHDGVGVMIESSWVQTVKKFTAVFAGELERREDFIEKKKKKNSRKGHWLLICQKHPIQRNMSRYKELFTVVHSWTEQVVPNTDFGLTASLKTMKKLHIPLFGFHFKCLMDRVLIRFTQ